MQNIQQLKRMLKPLGIMTNLQAGEHTLITKVNNLTKQKEEEFEIHLSLIPDTKKVKLILDSLYQSANETQVKQLNELAQAIAYVTEFTLSQKSSGFSLSTVLSPASVSLCTSDFDSILQRFSLMLDYLNSKIEASKSKTLLH